MTAAKRLYPFPPARMQAPMAAYYLGVAPSTFLERVAAGTYPKPVADGRNRLWLTRDLDLFVENGTLNAPGGNDPYLEGINNARQGP